LFQPVLLAILNGEIIELMKEPAKRSELVKELLKGMPPGGTDKVLSLKKAAKIARELRDFPSEKMFEVAAYVIRVSKEVAFDIIELMKEPAKRSELVKELLKGMPIIGTDKPLSVEKAVKIARELKDFSLEKMFEVAAYVIRLTKEVAFDIIEKVVTYPKKTMEQIHQMVRSISKGKRLGFEFGSHIVSFTKSGKSDNLHHVR